MSDTPRTDAEVNRRWDSIRTTSIDGDFARQLERELAAMTKERDEAKAKLQFLKDKGLTVGIMKTSDKPEPYFAYVFESGSELDDMPTVNKLVYTEIERDQLKARVSELHTLLLEVHTDISTAGIVGARTHDTIINELSKDK